MWKKGADEVTKMYQIEVKRYLVESQFNPSDGWSVTMHLDPMELANGGKHPRDKKSRAEICQKWLREKGVNLSKHDVYGPADLVATHKEHGTHIVEVEGDSSKQAEQSLYSAFGQISTVMGDFTSGISFGIAFPDLPKWQRQVMKIPSEVRSRLKLNVWLVSSQSARRF